MMKLISITLGVMGVIILCSILAFGLIAIAIRYGDDIERLVDWMERKFGKRRNK